MADQPTPEQILFAIQSSGYLMEQEVASVLEHLGLHVQTNRAFEDIEEGKSRELDVAAVRRVHFDEKNRIAVFVELLCECKNSRNPFAFLLRPTTVPDSNRKNEEIVLPQEFYHVRMKDKPNTMQRVDAIDYLGIRPLHYGFGASLKAVQFAKIVREKGTWAANHSGLYDAIFYPLVKGLLARKKEVAAFGGEWKYVWLFFPIVVTSGDLFVMNTADDPPTPTLTDSVTYVRHIKQGKIDGYFAVEFVTQSALKRHVEEKIMPYAKAVGDLARLHPEKYRES
jgi:hypothetical protein